MTTLLEPQPLTEEQILTALAHPDETTYLLDKADAEESFAEFFKQAWHVVDPGTPLCWGWIMDAIAEHLQAITERRLRKVLINIPPGISKTMFTCVMWPAWEWGPRNMPHLRYIKASYNEGLSLDANVLLRRLVKSEWYQQRWGDRVTVADDQDAKGLFGNTATGWARVISIGGATTGKRGDRFIIDDPHNAMEAESDAEREKAVTWMFEAASTRHNNPDDPVEVLIMQRLHELDCSGAILAEPGYFGYEHLCVEMEFDPDHPVARKIPSRIGWVDPRTLLPPGEQEGALCFPERYTPQAVENLKQKFRRGETGSLYAEAGQLQQWPVGRKGGMFEVDKVRIMELHELGLPESIAGLVVRGWDLAGSTRKTSPYTAAPAMMRHGNLIVVLDVVRARVAAPMLDKFIAEVADADDARWGHVHQDLPQDPGQAGLAQVAHLSSDALAGHTFAFSLESGEKEIRAFGFASQVNAGNVVLVKGPWNAPYLQEMRMFPAGARKDQIDGSSRAYARLIVRKPPPTIAGGVCIDLSQNHDGSWSLPS